MLGRGQNGSGETKSAITLPGNGIVTNRDGGNTEGRTGKRKKAKKRLDSSARGLSNTSREEEVPATGVRGWWQQRKEKLSSWWQDVLRQAEKK